MKKTIAIRRSPATDAKRPITAYDVAELAGVSQSAVSRAFTPGASVAATTKSKIMEAARQLNYRPNLIARSLITSRSNLVGVIIPPLENQFYAALLEQFSICFSRHGRRILFFSSQRGASVDPILEDVLSSHVDALVMVAASVASGFADECRQIGLPIVLLNRKTDSKLVSSVTGANRKGAQVIADFLVAGRHSRFAYLAGLETSSTNRDREEAFTARLRENGKALSHRGVGDFSTAGASRATRELLRSKRPPDAIFCANDHMALAAIDVARTELGLAVGKDISIVGFDDSELSGWPIFGLTTYSQPVAQMAERAAQIVQEQLDGDSGLVSVVEIEGELVVRTSARVPRHGVSGPAHRRVWKPSLG